MVTGDIEKKTERSTQGSYALPPKLVRKVEKLIKKGKLTEPDALQDVIQAKFDNSADFIEATQIVGDYLLEQGNKQLANECFELVLATDPKLYPIYAKIGLIAYKSKQSQRAFELFKHYLSFDQMNVEVVKYTAELALDLALVEEAWQWLNHLLKIDPNDAWACEKLGRLAFDRGNMDLAEQLFAMALRLGSESAALANDYGATLENNGKHDAAIVAFKRALELQPNTVLYLNNIVHAYNELVDFKNAKYYADKAIKYGKNDPTANYNMGVLLEWNCQFEECIPFYKKAISLGTDMQHVYRNLANVYYMLGRFSEGEALGEKGLKKYPDYGEIGINLAFCCFAQGKWEKGAAYYDHRTIKNRIVDIPAWNGEDLTGKKLLIWSEQGIGDQLMFCWYLPLLKAEKVEVIIELEPRLVDLVQRSYPWVKVIAEDSLSKDDIKKENCDWMTVQASLLNRYWREVRDARDLYLKFARELMQEEDSQLIVDAEQQSHWKNWLSGISQRPKIGICWRSGFSSVTRNRQYLAVNELPEIFSQLDVDVINLQYGSTQEEIEFLGAQDNMNFYHPDCDLKDDQDALAALISNLDLVISAGTAVHTLAGMLGRPTWVFRSSYLDSDIPQGAPFIGMIPTAKFILAKKRPIEAVISQLHDALVQHLPELNEKASW